MRKLKLNLADLKVASFDTGEDNGRPGTVLAHVTLPPSEQTCPDVGCEQRTWRPDYTCDYTCNCTHVVNCVSQRTACGSCELY
jgi:hypothetical protein